jgi:hypothetical protein
LLSVLPPSSAEAYRDPYRNHAQLNARITRLVSDHAKVARKHRVTITPQGRSVLAIEVDLDGRFDRGAPVLLVHGAIHGDEWVSAEVVLHLAEYTLATADDRLRGLRIHFLPVLNADGFEAGKREAVGRENQWYDANRDFPVPYQPDKPSLEVITAFRDYARRGRLAGVLDYHSPAASISWPWAFTRDKAPAGAESLAKVAEDMARSIGYRYGQTSKIISYKHQGTAQDYLAFAHKVPALLMELDSNPWRIDEGLQEMLEQERPFLIFARWLKEREAARNRAAADRPSVGAPGSGSRSGR